MESAIGVFKDRRRFGGIVSQWTISQRDRGAALQNHIHQREAEKEEEGGKKQVWLSAAMNSAARWNSIKTVQKGEGSL